MIRHKVKYRVVGADRTKRKYSINLDDGTSFHLTRELLQGTPAQEGSRPLCSFVVQNGALWIKAGADQAEILHNGQSVRECEARPGDLVQVGEFSVEVLECPHAARSESNATQFLDVSEMFGGAVKSSDAPTPNTPSAVEPTRAQEQVPTSAAASSIVANNEELPQAPETPSNSWDTQDSPTTIRSYAPTQESKPNHHTEYKAEPKDETRVVEHPTRGKSAPMQHRSQSSSVHSQDTQSSFNPSGDPSGAHAPAARTRSSYEDTRGTEDPSRSTSLQRSRSTSSHRDTERNSASRSPKRTEEAHKPRRQNEQAPAAFSETDFTHLGISAGMAALGVAATTRVLVSGSPTPQGMVVACAALSSIPVVFGLSLGLTRLNEFLDVDSHMRDYARFLGWAMICSVPWAYTQGASFPVAIFTTLLTTVLISVAFIGRFRPNMARFSGVGAGLSAAALAALITHHHFAADKNVAQEGNSTDTPAVADANSTAQAASASNAPGAQTAATTAQNPPAASPNSLSPQTAPAAQAQAQAPGQGAGSLAQQNAAPVLPSNVNDTIPPIPVHPDSSLGANPTGRTPANADPSAKGIIDPLAHEEFFSAIKMGNLEVVKSLIDRKQVDPDFTLDKGSTPLIVAAASGRMKVVEYLLRRRVNINAQDPHGTTALMWAVFKGHRDVAKFLISKGADTKVIRDDGDTAMDIARKWRQNEIVAILKDAAQDENGVSKKTRSPASRKRRHR